MTDDVDLDTEVRVAPLLRFATLLIGSIEIILFLLLAHLHLQSMEPRWDAIATLALPLVGLTLPGVLLAWLDRAPRTALALVLLAVPLLAVAGI
jgi:hypothetical protein